jgi:hypothetical protein
MPFPLPIPLPIQKGVCCGIPLPNTTTEEKKKRREIEDV